MFPRALAVCAIGLWALPALFAQNEVPRKASEYPAHASWSGFEIGAENMFHSIPAEGGTIFARDYLVIEIAIYPSKRPVDIAAGNFTLRINGGQVLLPPESPGFVAASVRYPDWEQRAVTTASAGLDDKNVTLGAPPPVARFPGDPTAGAPRMPRQEPPDDIESVGQPKEHRSLEQLVALAALPEGEARLPRKGCLYFAFKGKLKRIHTLDLLYDDSLGNTATLKLQ